MGLVLKEEEKATVNARINRYAAFLPFLQPLRHVGDQNFMHLDLFTLGPTAFGDLSQIAASE